MRKKSGVSDLAVYCWEGSVKKSSVSDLAVR